MNQFAPVVLLLATMTLILLPFIPTLREWWQPSDDAPLPIDQHATYELRHFADSMRSLVSHLLGPDPSREALHQIGKSLFHNGTQVTVLHEDDGLDVLATASLLRAEGKLAHIVIFADMARIAASCESMADIFALRDLQVGPSAQLRACCSMGSLKLAQNVLIHRWADAQSISAGRDLVVHGRITALHSIQFSDNTQFMRAGAPSMQFGEHDARHVGATSLPPQLSAPVARRYVFDGDTTLSEENVRYGDVVVRGSLQIAEDLILAGSIKAHDFLRLHEHVSVAGSLVAGKGIVIGAGCTVQGPLISEDDIIIGPNSVIGSLLLPTTVSCRKLVVAQGVVIHGVVTTQESAYVSFEEIPFG